MIPSQIPLMRASRSTVVDGHSTFRELPGRVNECNPISRLTTKIPEWAFDTMEVTIGSVKDAKVRRTIRE
jgi:hypothetical protein